MKVNKDRCKHIPFLKTGCRFFDSGFTGTRCLLQTMSQMKSANIHDRQITLKSAGTFGSFVLAGHLLAPGAVDRWAPLAGFEAAGFRGC